MTRQWVNGLMVAALLWSTAICRAAPGAPPASKDSRQTTVAFAKKTDEVSVLFIGNSYTYVHNMPALVETIARSRQCRLTTAMQAKGGYTLRQHWNDPQVQNKLGERKWDMVIVQDQSQMPARHPEQTIAYGTKFARAIRRRGARPIFFLTWGRRLADGKLNVKMQDQLLETYCRTAVAGQAIVAPVGLAWQKAMSRNPRLKLHAADASHPTLAGAYLTACVFYATIYNDDPTGAPATISPPAKAKLPPRQYRLPISLARFLQKIAWQTVTEFRENHTMEKVVRAFENKANAPHPPDTSP